MIRPRLRAAVLPAVAALALGGCGSQGAAELSEIAERSTPAGIAPELVYVTEIDGFDLATQSVGVSGDNGLSATYLDGNGAGVTLSTRTGAGAATLRAAGDAVRVPSENELEHLFSEVPADPSGPVERGDLPENGDGAPIDEPGPGG